MIMSLKRQTFNEYMYLAVLARGIFLIYTTLQKFEVSNFQSNRTFI